MQPGAYRRGRRLAGPVGLALAVGVLSDREGLGVTGAVRRVRVRALLGVSVTEVLRLAVAAVGLRPAALLRASVLLAASVLLLAPVLLLLRRRRRVAVRLLPALGALLSVRCLVLLRARLRGTVVPGAASDPESSHVIERTWSRRSTCAARGNGPFIGADL
ncbi:hypothetical protein GCM10023335_02440 [Streptomyces siamensis]|uniref:Integral membrane protein n=1 Tax=Streptomyces siamensis TaxID=1274986 RepID=A0ABP9IC02_9ACTN